MNNENIVLFARLKVKAERIDEAKSAALRIVADSRHETGCVNYDIHQSIEDAAVFFWHETWASKAALDEHFATRHFVEFFKTVEKVAAEPPQINLTRMISDQTNADKSTTPAYFSLRPEVEKQYGYAHAVKVGSDIKISGAVSMDDAGNPTAVSDLAQQMKNCYADLEKVLAHYGCTFDDVVVENIFTTDMPQFLEQSGYRSEIYKKQFPTGSWLGVKELALPEFMIEIELEAHKS